jgi:hypothetical protein
MYYQVCSTYRFFNGKVQLASLSLHTTTEYYPYLVGSYFPKLSNSRFFTCIKEAQGYISYLNSRYPEYTAPRPVLDAYQLSLF